MTISWDIDWLSAVFPTGWRLQPLDGELPFSAWRPSSGGNGYNRGMVDDITGTRLLWSTERLDMGTLYILSGQPLAKAARLLNCTANFFAALRLGFDIADATRLDIRFDIPDGGALSYQFAHMMDQGRVSHKGRKPHIHAELGTQRGCTVYTGSPKSSSYVRVYDKLAESRGRISATRVEAQLREYKARLVWRSLVDASTDDQLQHIAASVIAAHVQDFALPELNAIIDDIEPFLLARHGTEEKDAKRWLIHQVLPTFIRDALEHEGKPVLFEWFAEELRKRLAKE